MTSAVPAALLGVVRFDVELREPWPGIYRARVRLPMARPCVLECGRSRDHVRVDGLCQRCGSVEDGHEYVEVWDPSELGAPDGHEVTVAADAPAVERVESDREVVVV